MRAPSIAGRVENEKPVGGQRKANIYQIDELREFEFDADHEHVRIVDDGPHHFVVVGQQVVVEAFGVRIAAAAAHRRRPTQNGQQRQQSGQRCPHLC